MLPNRWTAENVRAALANPRLLEQERRTIYADNVETALDHGELLGERLGLGSHRSYGHTPGCNAPELRIVPWLEAPVTEGPVGFERLDEATVDDRLAALGYVTE